MDKKIKTQNSGVHHGARFISAKAVSGLLPGIDTIERDIKQFRRVAYEYSNNRSVKSERLYEIAPEKFNNNISILGQRGTGKTSAMMTFIEEIENNTYFKENVENVRKNQTDIITKIVDPEELGKGTDVLGWIITSINEYINSFLRPNYNEEEYDYSQFKDCFMINQYQKDIQQLLNKVNDLRLSYISSKREYAEIMYSKSNSLLEYTNKFKNMLDYDYGFHQQFNDFITDVVDFKRKQNIEIFGQSVDAEPLIYFFFDDVDTSTKHCPEILLNILNFLCHPNIVVCVSGDYEVFEKCMTRYFLENNSYPQKEVDEDQIDSAKVRSVFFLKKVLPSTYRYRIVDYTNEILFSLKYNNEAVDQFESFNVFQLLTYIFGGAFDENYKSGQYFEAFVLPSNENVNKTSESYITGKPETKYIYAYLSIFGKNVRSFMNVYNYLYSEAINISQLKEYKANEYWNTDRFSEFINILLESKFTYSIYRNEISRFLSIKYDKIDSDNSLNNIRNLRIDCEQLEILIKDILSGNKKELLDGKQSEIDSLIMLPIFINEIFYKIHKEKYKKRYERVKDKLKNILSNVFINSHNSTFQILPTKMDLSRTLCVYYRIISRLDLNTLSLLNPQIDSNHNFNRSHDKKYIVQLYYATLLLYQSNSKTVNEQISYDDYEISTYKAENEIASQDLTRNKLETKINKCFIKVFKRRDSQWFEDKKKYIENICGINRIIIEKIDNEYLKEIKPYLSNDIIESYNEAVDFININLMNINNKTDVDYYLGLLLYELYKSINKLNNLPDNIQINEYYKNIGIEFNNVNSIYKYLENIKHLINNLGSEFDKLKKLNHENIDSGLDDSKNKFMNMCKKVRKHIANGLNIEIQPTESDNELADSSNQSNDFEKIYDYMSSFKCAYELIMKEYIYQNRKHPKNEIKEKDVKVIFKYDQKCLYEFDIVSNSESSVSNGKNTNRPDKNEENLKTFFEVYYYIISIIEFIKILENEDTKFFLAFRDAIMGEE